MNEISQDRQSRPGTRLRIQTRESELKATVAKQQDFFAAKIAHQQLQIEALAATVQKVSNQLELNKSAQQVVASNQ